MLLQWGDSCQMVLREERAKTGYNEKRMEGGDIGLLGDNGTCG